MHARTPLALVLVLALLCLPACQMNERMSGTAFGGGGGLLLGALVAESVGGALVGGAAGALAGYLIGDYLADQRERGAVAGRQIQVAPQAASAPQVGGVKATSPARAAYDAGRAARTAPEARAHFERAVQLDPTYADAWNRLGLNHLSAGRTDEARAAFHRALAADPSHFGARRNLAWTESGVR